MAFVVPANDVDLSVEFIPVDPITVAGDAFIVGSLQRGQDEIFQFIQGCLLIIGIGETLEVAPNIVLDIEDVVVLGGNGVHVA